jgi:hypothetical protein
MASPTKTQVPQYLKSYVKSVNVVPTSMGLIITADVKSRSRPSISHYTRIVIDPLNGEVVKASCSCEGFTFGKECWHVKILKEMAKNEFVNELEKARQAKLKLIDDALNW